MILAAGAHGSRSTSNSVSHHISVMITSASLISDDQQQTGLNRAASVSFLELLYNLPQYISGKQMDIIAFLSVCWCNRARHLPILTTLY